MSWPPPSVIISSTGAGLTLRLPALAFLTYTFRHGNIRGPAGSYWAKAILHLELRFPADYPRSPPHVVVRLSKSLTLFVTPVQLLTPIPHPFVMFGNTICLDLLTQKSSLAPNGWTSAYTVHVRR